MHIKRGIPILDDIDKLGFVGFISNLGFASVATIWAIYLQTFFHNESSVGFFITVLTVISLLACIFIIPLIERWDKIKLYGMSIALYGIFYLLFGFLSSLRAIITISIIMAVIISLRVTAYGIIISDKSKKKNLAKNEGFIYTFMNLSWLVGPLIAGFISRQFGLRAVFIISAVFIGISYFLFLNFKVRDGRTTKNYDKNLLKIIIDFFRDKDLVVCYILSGAINFWWALIYVYMPLTIVDSGYVGEYVGYFLFGINLPLILFTYLFGKIAGKVGFKKIFFFGYLLLGASAMLCFFIHNLLLILGILVVASTGAAMVESTSESYFFDISKRKKDRFYGVYNTTIDINNAIATFIAATILIVASFKYLYLFFGGVMVFVAILSLKIQNIIEDVD
jgi:MFS family permease